MRVARAYTYGYIRTFDGLIDRLLSLRIYLYSIECSHLVPLALSRSTAYARGEEKNMKSPRPLFPHAWHSINSFFFRSTAEIFTKTDRLSYSRQTKKWGGGRARLINGDPSRSGQLLGRKSKHRCDRMGLTLRLVEAVRYNYVSLTNSQ